jgi:hypothetical protein
MNQITMIYFQTIYKDLITYSNHDMCLRLIDKQKVVATIFKSLCTSLFPVAFDGMLLLSLLLATHVNAMFMT